HVLTPPPPISTPFPYTTLFRSRPRRRPGQPAERVPQGHRPAQLAAAALRAGVDRLRRAGDHAPGADGRRDAVAGRGLADHRRLRPRPVRGDGAQGGAGRMAAGAQRTAGDRARRAVLRPPRRGPAGYRDLDRGRRAAVWRPAAGGRVPPAQAAQAAADVAAKTWGFSFTARSRPR